MRYITTIWGDAEFDNKPLRKITLENVIYLPFSKDVFFDHQTDWGIYLQDGHLVEQSEYSRGAQAFNADLKRQFKLECLDIETAPFDEMVYGGPIIPQYGHFIMSSLARMHAIDGSIPVLFNSHPPVFVHELRYVKEFIAAAGLVPQNCMSFEKPTFIKKIHLPDPAVVEQQRIHLDAKTSYLKIGNAFAPTDDFVRNRIYISRARLRTGTAGFYGEEIVEQKFMRAGFRVIHPEQLSISEQINMFRNASIIAGSISSGFHTLLLANESEVSRCIFNFQDMLNSNFTLVDHVSRGRSYYFSMAEDLETCHMENFMSFFRPKNIHRLADNMVSAALAVAQT